jgi:hypothetical protein
MAEPVKGRERDVESDKPAKELVTEDMKKKAAASRKKATAAAKAKQQSEQEAGGLGVLRTKGGGRGATAESLELIKSDIPYPKEVHGENFEFYGPHGWAAEIPEGTDITAMSEDQEFVINPEKVDFLRFQKPGRNLPKKRLYNIKGLHKDGRLSQFPFEPQINNTAGGDPQDAIGLRRYQRKGIYLFIEWDTMRPVYCGAWNCFAQAAQEGEFVGFCSMRHAQHTLPNRFKNAGGMMNALGRDVTTSRVWNG